MNRLSACLITFNEEQNLPRALRSVRGVADEIVVVDSGSRDRTQEMAREYGARVVVHSWTDFAQQKNIAGAAASNDWILSLDADEELSSELRASLLAWKEKDPEFAVYEFSRRALYLGGWIKHSGWYPDYQRRLYRRDATKFHGIVHESLKFEGRAGRLHGDLFHYTIGSVAAHAEKVDRYTTLAAWQMHASGARNWRAAMWFATPWTWFRSFVVCAGFLDGRRGWVISRMAARGTWMKFQKLGRLIAAERERRAMHTP